MSETFTKRQIGVSIGVIGVIIIILLIAIFKKESYTTVNETYDKELRENFPQTSAMNVLYSDASGNLSSTSDLGVDYLSVNNDISANGKIYFRNTNHSDDSDVYFMEKKRDSGNNNSLRLYINDDENESFQIWGHSCASHACTGDGGTMKHKFVANGNTEHTGALSAGSISTTGSLNAGTTTTGALSSSSISTTGSLNAGTTTIGALSTSSISTTGKIYSKADIGDSSSGHEFRHTNELQGIGIGYNSIYATGSNTDQDVNIIPKGSGKVKINGRDILAELDVIKDKLKNVKDNDGIFTINGDLEIKGRSQNPAVIFMPQLQIESHNGHDAFRVVNRLNIANKAAPGWYTDIAYQWGGGRRI